MLSKHLTKVVQNLEKKKFREKYNLFKAEGEKLVEELLQSELKVDSVLGLGEWLEDNSKLLENRNVIEVDEREMKSLSNFLSPPPVIALAEIPAYQAKDADIRRSLSLVLNGIQDPGNLGTIMRVADWFGVRYIFCDEDCASFHNPKCVQASMGAVFRVKVVYENLVSLLQHYAAESFHRYGTFLDGENIYKTDLDVHGFIVMGNEGKGISAAIEPYIDRRLTIPSFANNEFSTESLNVGVATGIVLSEFKRRL